MAGGDKTAVDSLDSLEFTPTWAVATVCAIFVIISMFIERLIHRLGKALKKSNKMPLFEALQKLKEELMLLGFISLFLTVFQSYIIRICIPERFTHDMLPCTWPGSKSIETVTHHRRLLAAGGGHACKEGYRPFVSLEGMHQLHIFIFVLALVHVLSCVLTMLLGSAKSRRWKSWEDEAHSKELNKIGSSIKVTHVATDAFVSKHSVGAKWTVLSWVISFFKQFYGSVRRTDYTTLRLGFIETHCKTNPKFNFHKYMMRSLEADFKKVVGISGPLWFFAVIFLLLNIDGWHTYFWISFMPLILLLIIGTKLEHVITQLAKEVLEKHVIFAGEIVVRPSDEHFWFGRPKLILKLIHLILFQNAFELAYFLWIWTTFGLHSCIMEDLWFVVVRLIVCILVQTLCGYSTLPLYALITQMGSSFKSSIFEEHVQQGISVWREKAKMHAKKPTNQSPRSNQDIASIQFAEL